MKYKSKHTEAEYFCTAAKSGRNFFETAVIKMKNNNNFAGSFLSSKKAFYVTVALGLVAVIVAAVAVRTTSGKVRRELSSIADENLSLLTGDVETPVEDEPDTRVFTPEEDTTEEISEEHGEETTREKQTEKATITEAPPTEAAAQISNSSYCAPIDGEIQKAFSPETPVESKTMGDYRTHNGVDFEGDEGEDVFSVGNGIVTRVLVDSMWGYVVEIDHGDFTARYIGLSQENAVSINDEVKAGQKIGVLTSIPAEREDEPHLHFEVLKDSKVSDPLAALGMTQ